MSRKQIEAEMSPSFGIFIDGEFVVTISLEKQAGYFDGEWWVSRLNSENYLVMFAHFAIPVDATNQRDAKEVSNGITEELMKVVRLSVFAENAHLGLVPSSQFANFIFQTHANAHLQARGFEFFEVMTATQRTLRLYEFAKSIGISTPAVSVSEIEGVPPKTIHERLRDPKRADLRKQNPRNN